MPLFPGGSNVSFFFPPLSVIDKFDYVFAENGTVQYKNGQLVSKQVSPTPFAAMALLPYPGRWAASSPQLLSLLGGLHGKSSIFTSLSLSSGHSGPLGGGAAAGSDQLLSQLHGTAEAAQETVTAQLYASGNHDTDFWGVELQISPKKSRSTELVLLQVLY